MKVVSLRNQKTINGIHLLGGMAQLGFRSVELEMGLGHPLEMSRVQSAVCKQPLVKGPE